MQECDFTDIKGMLPLLAVTVSWGDAARGQGLRASILTTFVCHLHKSVNVLVAAEY